MEIRAAVPDDAAEVVALRAVVYPYLVRGVDSTRRMISEPPPGEHWAAFVAEIDARLVGWVSAYRNDTTSEPDFGEISLLHVHPDQRRRAVGAALLGAAGRHLRQVGVRRVRAWARPPSLDFARRYGFEPSREIRYSKLELRSAPSPRPGPAEPVGPAEPLRPAVASAPAGIQLVPLSALDPEVLCRAQVAAGADEPGDVPLDAISYPIWRYEVWEDVGLDKVASVAAVVGRSVLAFTLVSRDGERMWSELTATLPEYRGRGLARLVKVAALRRAADRGVTVAYTSNDDSNAGMLAVNTRLGYRPVGVQWSCLATLG